MTVSAKRFGVIGHKGRMGRALAAVIEEAGHTMQIGVDTGGNPLPLATQCDVLVDFSAPEALQENLDAAKTARIPILVGTTGLQQDHFVMLAEAAEAIPVLQTGNTSLGVTLLAHLVREAAAKLGQGWDIEILTTTRLRANARGVRPRLFLDLGEIIMMRKCMLGIKRRAEQGGRDEATR